MEGDQLLLLNQGVLAGVLTEPLTDVALEIIVVPIHFLFVRLTHPVSLLCLEAGLAGCRPYANPAN